MKTTKIMAGICLCLATATSFNANAQFAATMPDLSAGANSGTQNINCDLAELRLNSNFYTLATVAWDNTTGSTPGVKVYLDLRGYSVGGSTSTTITLNTASKPDVALGHVGSTYYLAVVYEQSKKVMLNVYRLNMTATPTITTTPTFTGQVSGANTATWPHIDAWVAPTTSTTDASAALADFVITWQELNGGAFDLKGQVRTFTAPSGSTAVSMISGNATSIINSDVSAYTVYNGTPPVKKYMCVIYTKANGGAKDLYMESEEPANPASAVPLETAQNLEAPRIESQNYVSTGGVGTNWMATCPKMNIGGTRDIWEYDNTTAGPVQNITSFFGAGDYPQAAISGGFGNGASVYPGIMFWCFRHGIIGNAAGNNTVKMVTANMSGGSGSFIPTYFDVNMTALGAGSPGVPVAASSSSNSSHHQLAAWLDLSLGIRYKISYDSASGPHFRTTGVINMTGDGVITLYPNPTTADIALNGITQANYMITDAIGRNVGSGIALKGNYINTSFLPAGNYYLQVSEEGKTQTLRFVKQ